jgi:hypothetical protein
MDTRYAKKGTRRAIMVIECVVSVAALVAGLLFIVQPNGSLVGMTTATLSATPFSD